MVNGAKTKRSIIYPNSIESTSNIPLKNHVMQRIKSYGFISHLFDFLLQIKMEKIEKN